MSKWWGQSFVQWSVISQHWQGYEKILAHCTTLTSGVVGTGLMGVNGIRWDKGLYCLEGEAPKEEEWVGGLVHVGWVNVNCLAKVGGFWTGRTGAGPNLSKMLWRSWLLVFCWFNRLLSFCPIVER